METLPSNLIEVKVENFCDPTSPHDFEAMFRSRITQDTILKAMNDMKDQMFALVDESNDGDNCLKALEILEAIRKRFIGIEKSTRKAKKNIGSKDGLEKACKSGDFTKKKECEAEKRSYSHRIGANLDSLEI
ncbi:ATP-dependent DNA helicase II subunit 2 [Stylosanthes scabra]|uniref:ATP-dependent DNA helicase II subunit 2 n=1 Tax=Stylosanthes scabra TaxID=79078 RepID=A0ABU6RSG7_9FABA|nr:ATP-dependent DNA helicase II subunit 2 [Stylosanthes scabra]